MLANLFGLYQTGFDYPGRSPILLVQVNPELQWTHRYFISGASVMFDRYFPFMKALHVYLSSRRHQFSSILDSDAAARVVSTKRIMLTLNLLCENTS